ncbi:MAG: hypothetical protein LBR69_03160 [Endomicrobium sp.]|jgi:hypothetical protein|nr:hypothetical protein [Endomicrobium sp.]
MADFYKTYKKYLSTEKTLRISRKAAVAICFECYVIEAVIAMGVLAPDLNELEFERQVATGRFYPENLQ